METGHILNVNQNNKRVEVTVERHETEKITMQLGENLKVAQRPIRSLITPTEGTPQWYRELEQTHNGCSGLLQRQLHCSSKGDEAV